MQATTTSPHDRSLSRWLLTVTVLAGVLLSLGTAGISAQEANPNGLPYIIVFKDAVNPHAAAPEFAKAYGLQPGFIYEYALKGMSAVVPEGRLIALQHDPRVAYVAEDLVRSIDVQEMPTGIQRIFADANPELAINGTDDYRVDVDVAVIDTGVDFQHPDLNVVGGVNCTASIFFASCKAGGDDDHYHGTHVAGTIGALDNGIGVVGVAPGARIWAVKVLNKQGSGYSSWIIAGIDWVAANAATIEVANMSLGGSGFSQAEYDAIQGAVNKGVAFAVAAGNDDADANNYSPGGFDNVLSVSALADFDGLPGGGAAPPAAPTRTTRWPTSATGVPKWTSPRRGCASCPPTRWSRASTARSAAPRWPARTRPAPWHCWRASATRVTPRMYTLCITRSRPPATTTGRTTRATASRSRCWT